MTGLDIDAFWRWMRSYSNERHVRIAEACRWRPFDPVFVIAAAAKRAELDGNTERAEFLAERCAWLLLPSGERQLLMADLDQRLAQRRASWASVRDVAERADGQVPRRVRMLCDRAIALGVRPPRIADRIGVGRDLRFAIEVLEQAVSGHLEYFGGAPRIENA